MTSRMATMALLGAAMFAHADAMNLVTNGGFETGTLSGWTIAAAACGSDFGPTTNPDDAHSGNYAAFFAGSCPGSYDSIEQVLATTPAQEYNLTFFIETNGASGTRDLLVDWNGSQILDLAGAGTGSYAEYMFTEQATGSGTILEFQGFNEAAADFVDDISVTAVPEPSMGLPLLLGVRVLLRRRSRTRIE